MAFPTLIYNASSGSDTAASGSNAPTSAITGTNASGTGAANTITLNETVDFTAGTGVLDDDTDVVWCATTTGERHLFRITSFTGGAATCTALVVTEAIGATTFSGQNWAVGGIRKTLEADSTRRDITDVSSGWTMEFQAGTYDVTTIAVNKGDTTDGPLTMRAASGASPIIDGTTGAHYPLRLSGGIWKLQGLKLIAGASRACVDITGGISLAITDCHLDYSSTATGVTSSNDVVGKFCNSYFEGGISGVNGISHGGARCNLSIENNRFSGGDYGVRITSVASYSSASIVGNIFDTMDADGVSIEDADMYMATIDFNSFFGCLSDSIACTVAISTTQKLSINGNIIVDSGAYGINAASNSDYTWDADYNAFYNNTSGARNNLSAGTNDVTLTGDPFTASGSSDFSLNNTASAGAACRAVYPGPNTDGVNTGYRDLGALQHQDAGGGGGGGTKLAGFGGGMVG